MTELWDPTGTLRRTLWIGGAQWAGKTTVARILSHRHGLTAYHYDYHDARGHQDRRIARRVALGEPTENPDPETTWVRTTPEDMAAETIAGFPVRFEWALDDLRALFSERPILAEGWGLRPDLVAPILDTPRRMIVLLPTEDFRRHQLATVPRTSTLNRHLSNPERAQANRIARDRLVGEEAARQAEALTIRVLRVDGSQDADAIADEVADHFAPFLGRDR
ncbi:hypothetical protein GCM10009839_16710 [Catenulispora yoronensis]|uniref:Uncharacterized protein n=1 Tax=Catenulispora yoronensis TaxID=450799 RepID=A0ABN2TU80_9ACTN